jgi:hypothetical protein
MTLDEELHLHDAEMVRRANDAHSREHGWYLASDD